jgi:uncharacterized membrane protein
MFKMEWYVFAIGAAIFYTLFQIARKKALMKAHAMNFESIRTIFVVLIGLFLIPFMDWSFDKGILFLVYGVSLIATVGILFTAKAFRHNDISLISPLANLRPAFVAVLAYFFLSESLGVKQMIGIGILLVSAYLLEADHHLSDFVAPIKHLMKSKESLYFIFAMFLFSIGSIFDKYIIGSKITNVFTYFFLIWVFIAINFNIVHAFLYGFKEIKACLKKTRYLPFVVALFSVAGSLFALQAISMAYVSLVMPSIILSSLMIVIFGGTFFHEKYLSYRIVISVLMILGAYLIIV